MNSNQNSPPRRQANDSPNRQQQIQKHTGCLAFLNCFSSAKKRRPGQHDLVPGGGTRQRGLSENGGHGWDQNNLNSEVDNLRVNDSDSRERVDHHRNNEFRFIDQSSNRALQAIAAGNYEEQDVNDQARILREIHESNIKKMKERNQVRINTVFQKNDIEFIEHYPTEDNDEAQALRDKFKFYCPICLRYFNHMLISNCCDNYICRLCIGWQAKKAKKDDGYTILCSHCYKQEFRLNDVDEDDEAQLKLYTDTPIRCQQQLNQNRFKDALESQTARREQDDSTPNGIETIGGSKQQSEEPIVTPREFSKHLISTDKDLIQIQATDRKQQQAERDPIENLEQLMGHQILPEIQMQFGHETPRPPPNDHQKMTYQSDFLPESDRKSLHLPQIVANNLMSKQNEKILVFSQPLNSDRSNRMYPQIDVQNVENDRSDPIRRPGFVIRKSRVEKANKENMTAAVGNKQKWGESPYILKKKFVNMTSVKKNKATKGIMVMERFENRNLTIKKSGLSSASNNRVSVPFSSQVPSDSLFKDRTNQDSFQSPFKTNFTMDNSTSLRKTHQLNQKIELGELPSIDRRSHQSLKQNNLVLSNE